MFLSREDAHLYTLRSTISSITFSPAIYTIDSLTTPWRVVYDVVWTTSIRVVRVIIPSESR